MNAQLTEIMRLISNLIRTGTVTEVDRKNWLCRVKVGELETNWINWLTLRAGGARTWWCPSLDEQVVVLSMGGNLETAFALPAIYSSEFSPPSDSVDGCVTQYPDGGWFEYEPATGRWHVKGIKSMVIEAAENITLKTSEFVVEADNTRINSEVVINGAVTQGGGAMSSNGIVVDDRGAYTGVIASWLHTREPKKKETTKVKRRCKKTAAPKAPEEKQGDYLVGTDEKMLVLSRTYANRGNAERAAKMQW